MTVLEKLLVPESSRRVVDLGYDWLTGPVYRPDDLIGPRRSSGCGRWGSTVRTAPSATRPTTSTSSASPPTR